MNKPEPAEVCCFCEGSGEDVKGYCRICAGLGLVDPEVNREHERKAELNKSGTNALYESVNHPKHYNSHPAGIECIDVIQDMSYNVGAAMKYLWRAGLKPSADFVEDMEKAIRYIQFEIERVKRNKEAERAGK